MSDHCWGEIIQTLQSAENRVTKIILDDNNFKTVPAEFFCLFKKVHFCRQKIETKINRKFEKNIETFKMFLICFSRFFIFKIKKKSNKFQNSGISLKNNKIEKITTDTSMAFYEANAALMADYKVPKNMKICLCGNPLKGILIKKIIHGKIHVLNFTHFRLQPACVRKPCVKLGPFMG